MDAWKEMGSSALSSGGSAHLTRAFPGKRRTAGRLDNAQKTEVALIGRGWISNKAAAQVIMWADPASMS